MKSNEIGCPLTYDTNQPKVGQIIRDLGESFLDRTPLSYDQKRVFRRLGECRTAVMGGGIWHCSSCNRTVGVYHSCRDRHCPNCKAMDRKKWTESRLAELLPIPYFHVVFTLPHELNNAIFRNPRQLLGLLFKAASKTLLEFAENPAHLGAQPGITMVLHTWGQQLKPHYHVHCIVTGGGLNQTRDQWIPSPKKDYLFPFKALAKVFRGKYLSGMDEIKADLDLDGISTERDWLAFKRRVGRKKKWVVYIKEPFGGPEQVIKYLAQYTNRIAISNNRIRSYQNGKVTFSYKDYKHNHQVKELTLEAGIFIRRILLHVLPSGFHRIRYYGFLSSRQKTASIDMAKRLLGAQHLADDLTSKFQIEKEPEPESEKEDFERPCPHCDGVIRLSRTLQKTHQDLARKALWSTDESRLTLKFYWDTS